MVTTCRSLSAELHDTIRLIGEALQTCGSVCHGMFKIRVF